MNLNVERKQKTSRANKAIKNWAKESFFPKKMYKQPMIHEKILKSLVINKKQIKPIVR